MTARATLDYVLKEGEVFEGAFLYLQSDDVTPVDMTGWTAKLQIRKSAGGTLYQTLTDEDGITITLSTGRVSWIVHSEDTALWTFKKAEYDLKLIDASDDERFIIEGAIRIEKRVTA